MERPLHSASPKLGLSRGEQFLLAEAPKIGYNLFVFFPFLSMRTRSLLLIASFVLLFPVSSTLAARERVDWGIVQNLPTDHPCADAGGVWRGWCMNMGTIRAAFSRSFLNVGTPPRLTTTGGGADTSTSSFPCIDLPVSSIRTSCYIDWRRALWGQ